MVNKTTKRILLMLVIILGATLFLQACETQAHYDDPILPDRDVDTTYNQR